MLFDLTLSISRALTEKATANEKMVSLGHLGTHFDVMNKIFPLEYTIRDAIVFDVSGVKDRDIDISDADFSLVKSGMFVAFYTGYIQAVEYGTSEYFTGHPQLSNRLIEQLVNLNVSIIGVDFAGVRRGKEHTPKDQECADQGVFIVENLWFPYSLLNGSICQRFKAYTFPIKFEGMTGLPCRVVAEQFG